MKTILLCIKYILLIISCEVSMIDAACDTFYHSDDYPVAFLNFTYIDPQTSVFRIDDSDIGRYGLGKIQDLTAVVAHVTSNNHTSHMACDHIDTDNLPREPYIALIKHGECREYIKLLHAAHANASGVVVYSYNMESKLLKLGYKGVPSHYVHDYLPIFILDRDAPLPQHLKPSPTPKNYTRADLEVLREFIVTNTSKANVVDFLLPFVFIGGDKGTQIAQLVDNGTRVVVSISCMTYPIRSHASVLFVCISFVFLMVLLMSWLIFYYVQRFRSILAKDLLSKRLCSAAMKALERIPVKTMTPSDMIHVADDECCAVCIEPMRPNEVVRILPCQHSFHKACVDPWLIERRSCPMCKLDIVVHFGIIYTGSQESLIELEDIPLTHHEGSQQEIIRVTSSRRNSASQTSPRLEERVTSTCVFVQVNDDFKNSPREKSWRFPRAPKAVMEEDDLEDDDDMFAAGPSGIFVSSIKEEEDEVKVESSILNGSEDLVIEVSEIPPHDNK